MIKTKDIKNFKHISDPTEEKLNNLKLVSQDTNKDIVSIQGELTKDILKTRSLERLDAIEADSSDFNGKIGEIETSVTEKLTEITDRTETVISNSEKYKQDIEAFLSVANGDDFLFFLDDCTRAVGRLDKLTDGTCLCAGKKITSWDIPLPVLTRASRMFCLTKLTTLDISLPVLTNGEFMFDSCKSLKSFTSDLPALTNGTCMFIGCTALTSFTSDLPTLTNGDSMFQSCAALTSFTSDLPVLTNGNGMFYDCTALMSFTADLPALTNGNVMFNRCKLGLASVENIAATINDLAAQNKTGKITIGMQKAIQGNADLATALATIRDKGWTIIEQYN